MRPDELTPDSFHKYQPKARVFAVQYLNVLQQLPMAFLPILLEKVIQYGWQFPAEQKEISAQMKYLSTQSVSQMKELLDPFAGLQLPATLSRIDWVNQPREYTEELTATLWSTHQIDQYRVAARAYNTRMQHNISQPAPILPRLGIVVVGQGVTQPDTSLFCKLRPHGVLFTNVDPADGLVTLRRMLNKRVAQNREPYAHWYIDGSQPDAAWTTSAEIVQLYYQELMPANTVLLHKLQNFIHNPADGIQVGPEAVRSYITALTPEDLKLDGPEETAPLRYFEASLLTGGAGTQIFSTTFVQWAARESLRRAQPSTLLARFTPRQNYRSLNEMLSRQPSLTDIDPTASLVDADMGAYYTWIDQQRLSGAEEACFLVWFERHGLVLVIAPTLPRGTLSEQSTTLQQILDWMEL